MEERTPQDAPPIEVLQGELWAAGLPREGDGEPLSDRALVEQIAGLARDEKLTQHQALLALFIDPRFSDDGIPAARLTTIYDALRIRGGLSDLVVGGENPFLPAVDFADARTSFAKKGQPASSLGLGFADVFDDRLSGSEFQFDEAGNFSAASLNSDSDQVRHGLQAMFFGNWAGADGEPLFDALAVGHETVDLRFGIGVPKVEKAAETVAQAVGGALMPDVNAYQRGDVEGIEVGHRLGQSVEDLRLSRAMQDIGGAVAAGEIASADQLAARLWALGK